MTKLDMDSTKQKLSQLDEIVEIDISNKNNTNQNSCTKTTHYNYLSYVCMYSISLSLPNNYVITLQ